MTTFALPQLEPEWRLKSRGSYMRISISQIEAHDLCPRKWWLDSVRKLPTISKKSQIIGSVIHSVIERYLKADERGYDPATGKAVDLYPPGWHVSRSRFDPNVVEGSIDPVQQVIVRKLITEGIAGGVISRRPGREIEKEFRLNLGLVDGIEVELIGYIDLGYPDEVNDHKSTGNMRYAKSPNALKKSVQMMTYAATRLSDAASSPKKIKLRHNIFSVNPDDLRVKKVEAEVTPVEVERFWQSDILPSILNMVKLRKRVEKWHEINEPPTMPQCCNAFGGCAFRTICHGQESESAYKERVDRILNGGNNQINTGGVLPPVEVPVSKPSLENTMSQFAARMAQRQAMLTGGAAAPAVGATPPPAPAAAPAPAATAAAAGGTAPAFRPKFGAGAAPKPTVQVTPVAAAPTPAPVPAAAPAPAVAASPTVKKEPNTVGDQPPWADPDCIACGGSGFNSKGEPCRVCSTKAKKAGRPTPDEFLINPPDGEGAIYWFDKTTQDCLGGCQMIAAAAAQATTAKAAEAPAAAPAAAQNETPPADPQAADLGKGKRGRPPKSFHLMIGCRPVFGVEKQGSGRYVYDANRVLAEIGEAIVAEYNAAVPPDNKVESFYGINAFDRRDLLRSRGQMIAETIAADIICFPVCSGESDLRALLDGIRPFAGMESHAYT